MNGAPVMVVNENTKRETGRKAQLGNIQAAASVASVVRTTLGPRSMLKMILDPMGGIVLTNDGNAILREIDVAHPAAKSMIELSRTQDEEVGDGTTSVIILSGSLLSAARPFLERNMHPRNLVFAYIKALDTALEVLDEVAKPLDVNDREWMLRLVRSCLGTKFTARFGDLVPNLAIDAVSAVTVEGPDGKEIDIKRYARVEKIPGGFLEDSRVLDGLILNKDVTHPKMPRRVENPRVLLLDSPLEYKKGESQTNIEITQETDWEAILKQEEEYVENLCKQIIKHKPNIVFTEKGVSDLAQHYLMKENIACIRRVRKTDNDRIARATGATIVNEPSMITEKDIGTGCGLFEVRKIGDDYFTYLEQCKDPKAVSIILRGASKDLLMEVERNLHDAMTAVRNIFTDPRVTPGGGATELAIGHAIRQKAKEIEGIQQWPFRAVADAFEVIPKTLIENCGANVIKVITELRGKHAKGNNSDWGVNGETGVPTNMRDLGVFEPYAVKAQTIKTALESACMILRIDDICSGLQGAPHKQEGDVDPEEADTFGDARDG